MSSGTQCWASLISLELPKFVVDEVAESGTVNSESDTPLDGHGVPSDESLNCIRLTARKGLAPSGSPSSSSSSPSPTSSSSGSFLCDYVTDLSLGIAGEQSERLYADSHLFIPGAVHSRLFRPPRVA